MYTVYFGIHILPIDLYTNIYTDNKKTTLLSSQKTSNFGGISDSPYVVFNVAQH